MIDYKTEQWFTSSGRDQLLSSRVLSASIENMNQQSLTEPVRFRVRSPRGTVPPAFSDCVFFSEEFQQWTSGTGACSVENKLILGVDRYVSCSCAHMSAYAVRVNAGSNSLLVGFPIWFHISCFICMGCVTLVILTHHLCHTTHMFPVNLLMHMCFAIIATEICYVIDGFLSPWHILYIEPNGDNYRCIIMSLFLHYFFVAQFFWLFLQAVCLYRVLLLNDENTRRFYLLFFLIGWGGPVLFVGLFYLVVYLIYRFATTLPVDKIYGDVLGNSNFCFITNGYVALGGILLPGVVCLLVAGAICVQAFALFQQWEDYDNIYLGQRNILEMKILVGFWSVFVLTCLWMSLHVSLGEMWTVVLFVIFNILLGLYALVAYGIIRWTACLELCLPESKKKPGTVKPSIETTSPAPLYSQQNKTNGDSAFAKRRRSSQPSQAKTVSDFTPAKRHVPTLHVRRSAPSPTDIVTPYDKRPTAHGVNILDDFDDIIYSLNEDLDQDYKSRDRKYNRHPIWDAPSETSFAENDLPVFYDRKRINIADTHI